MMKQAQAILALLFLFVDNDVARADTLEDLLLARDDTTLFAKIVGASGATELDTSTPYTMFVPTDEAIRANEKMMLYLNKIDNEVSPWKGHLKEVFRQHLVEDDAPLEYDDIFNFERTTLNTLRDPVAVRQFTPYKIQNAQIIDADIVASNGIMHVVDTVIEPNFMNETFADLELQSEYGPDDDGRTSLVTIADLTGARDGILDQNNNTEGLTMLGCRIRAFNRLDQYLTQSILGGDDVKHQEFLNESYTHTTDEHFFKYNLIPQNLYFEDYLDYTLTGYEALVMPVNPCAHMWVTMSYVDGGDYRKLCFNNACIVTSPYARNYYSANGFGHVIDKCLVCPGVAMMTQYTAEFTSHSVVNTGNLFASSLWNLRNLSLSVGDQHSVTLIAPLDSGWEGFNLQDITRLSTLKWITHLRDLLKHFLTKGIWTRQDFVNLYRWNGHQPYYIEMLTGEQVLIDYDDVDDKLKFGEAELYFTDVKGLDGMMHFADKVNFPRSVTETCYDVGKENGNFSTQVNLIDAVQIRSDMRDLSPLTCMFAPNEAWRNYVFELETISEVVLENHVFKELWWCEDLRNMVGYRLESHNYETWRVSVNEDNMPCFDTIPVFGGGSKRACIVECDILTRNGLVHILDDLMLYEQPNTAAPEPTHSPNFDPNSTNTTDFFSTDDAFVIGGDDDDDVDVNGAPTSADGTIEGNAVPTLIASQNVDSGTEGRTTMVDGGMFLGTILVTMMTLLCAIF